MNRREFVALAATVPGVSALSRLAGGGPSLGAAPVQGQQEPFTFHSPLAEDWYRNGEYFSWTSTTQNNAGRAVNVFHRTFGSRNNPAIVVVHGFRSSSFDFHDLVTVMDGQVGEILAELEADGLAEETVVFFYGDHGRGLPRAKRWAYDSGLQVPLIVRWPGRLEAGSVRDDLVSFLDFAPTLLSLGRAPVPDHMQGRVFLGEGTEPPPAQLFFTRDRMDETYDRIRGVRDERYKNIRNFEPGLPYAQPIAYVDKTPMMQEWRRPAAEGTLTGPPARFFAKTKPAEELYDTEADRHEVINLADEPAHADRLATMREALESWIVETGDLGEVPEAELVSRFRPDGVPPTTEPPKVQPQGGIFHGPPQVTITCPTDGATAVFTTDPGDEPQWHLYAWPFWMGDPRLQAQCGRLGYFDSDIVSYDFDVEMHWLIPEGTSPRRLPGQIQTWR